MISRLIWGLIGVLLIAHSADAQEIVFSRRVYAARGQTFQQLWMWSLNDRSLKPLTNSARDHRNPVCSPDGTHVLFEAGMDPLDQRSWRFDITTGLEQTVVDGSGRAANTTTNASAAPTSDPVDVHVSQCDDRTRSLSPDGSRLACAASNDEDILIVDLVSRTEIERVPFEQRFSNGDPYPAWPLQSTWSPNGQRLLVGTYGEASSSTSSYLDYFILDLANEHWTRAFKGTDPTWLPDGGAIVYSTPRDLVPLLGSLTKRVWSADLAVYDLANGKQTLLTSGATNNEHPTLCPPANTRP